MNKYLQRCKELLKTSINKIVVIGNESCDLDSAVSSIAFAFFLEHKPSLLQSWHAKDTLVLPVLNVLRNELPLKTEVTFFLKQHGICLDDLVCKNDIEWDREQNMNVVLVDHHVTKLKQSIIGIVDHRPLDSNARFNEQAFRTIELVGSCATLIGREIVNSCALVDSNGLYSSALDLLYGAIVLDTVNFSKQADKAKPLDHEIAEYIETWQNITKETRSAHRESLFKSLVAARSDVSQLNAYQLLFKDLKTVAQNNRIVTVPGFPMAVQEYLNLPQREEHLSTFAGTTKSNVVCLEEVDGQLYTLNVGFHLSASFGKNCTTIFIVTTVVLITYLLSNVPRMELKSVPTTAFKCYGLFTIFLMHGINLTLCHQLRKRVHCIVVHLEKMITVTDRRRKCSNTVLDKCCSKLARDLRSLAIVQTNCFKAVSCLNDDCGLINVTLYARSIMKKTCRK
ncbi:AGAP004314-PA-like protein [Anopheles sinensis]|uniref:AGAP004314-PA-like protein n=1 Tax=Anopheles sinensis TaxID=74873 RepID=A0A084W795_ANOSI|nr:AGAP004314-PA-like protein [Anopheles sinensis]